MRQQITAELTVTATWICPKIAASPGGAANIDRAMMEFAIERLLERSDSRLHEWNCTRTHGLHGPRFKEHFILERIAEDEKLEAVPADYDTEIDLIADQADETPRRVRPAWKRRADDTLRNQIVERKVIELIEQHRIPGHPYSPPKDEVCRGQLRGYRRFCRYSRSRAQRQHQSGHGRQDQRVKDKCSNAEA